MQFALALGGEFKRRLPGLQPLARRDHTPRDYPIEWRGDSQLADLFAKPSEARLLPLT